MLIYQTGNRDRGRGGFYRTRIFNGGCCWGLLVIKKNGASQTGRGRLKTQSARACGGKKGGDRGGGAKLCFEQRNLKKAGAR